MRAVVLVGIALSVATSDAGPRKTFATLTVFGDCHMEHLCGAGPDGGPGPVGKELVCYRYVFRPDGTYTQEQGRYSKTRGRYTRVGRRITMTQIEWNGRRGARRTLTLSADSTTLDGLPRRSTEPSAEPFRAR